MSTPDVILIDDKATPQDNFSAIGNKIISDLAQTPSGETQQIREWLQIFAKKMEDGCDVELEKVPADCPQALTQLINDVNSLLTIYNKCSGNDAFEIRTMLLYFSEEAPKALPAAAIEALPPQAPTKKAPVADSAPKGMSNQPEDSDQQTVSPADIAPIGYQVTGVDEKKSEESLKRKWATELEIFESLRGDSLKENEKNCIEILIKWLNGEKSEETAQVEKSIQAGNKFSNLGLAVEGYLFDLKLHGQLIVFTAVMAAKKNKSMKSIPLITSFVDTYQKRIAAAEKEEKAHILIRSLSKTVARALDAATSARPTPKVEGAHTPVAATPAAPGATAVSVSPAVASPKPDVQISPEQKESTTLLFANILVLYQARKTITNLSKIRKLTAPEEALLVKANEALQNDLAADTTLIKPHSEIRARISGLTLEQVKKELSNVEDVIKNLLPTEEDLLDELTSIEMRTADKKDVADEELKETRSERWKKLQAALDLIKKNLLDESPQVDSKLDIATLEDALRCECCQSGEYRYEKVKALQMLDRTLQTLVPESALTQKDQKEMKLMTQKALDAMRMAADAVQRGPSQEDLIDQLLTTILALYESLRVVTAYQEFQDLLSDDEKKLAASQSHALADLKKELSSYTHNHMMLTPRDLLNKIKDKYNKLTSTSGMSKFQMFARVLQERDCTSEIERVRKVRDRFVRLSWDNLQERIKQSCQKKEFLMAKDTATVIKNEMIYWQSVLVDGDSGEGLSAEENGIRAQTDKALAEIKAICADESKSFTDREISLNGWIKTARPLITTIRDAVLIRDLKRRVSTSLEALDKRIDGLGTSKKLHDRIEEFSRVLNGQLAAVQSETAGNMARVFGASDTYVETKETRLSLYANWKTQLAEAQLFLEFLDRVYKRALQLQRQSMETEVDATFNIQKLTKLRDSVIGLRNSLKNGILAELTAFEKTCLGFVRQSADQKDAEQKLDPESCFQILSNSHGHRQSQFQASFARIKNFLCTELKDIDNLFPIKERHHDQQKIIVQLQVERIFQQEQEPESFAKRISAAAELTAAEYKKATVVGNEAVLSTMKWLRNQTQGQMQGHYDKMPESPLDDPSDADGFQARFKWQRHQYQRDQAAFASALVNTDESAFGGLPNKQLALLQAIKNGATATDVKVAEAVRTAIQEQKGAERITYSMINELFQLKNEEKMTDDECCALCDKLAEIKSDVTLSPSDQPTVLNDVIYSFIFGSTDPVLTVNNLLRGTLISADLARNNYQWMMGTMMPLVQKLYDNFRSECPKLASLKFTEIIEQLKKTFKPKNPQRKDGSQFVTDITRLIPESPLAGEQRRPTIPETKKDTTLAEVAQIAIETLNEYKAWDHFDHKGRLENLMRIIRNIETQQGTPETILEILQAQQKLFDHGEVDTVSQKYSMPKKYTHAVFWSRPSFLPKSDFVVKIEKTIGEVSKRLKINLTDSVPKSSPPAQTFVYHPLVPPYRR